MVLSRDKTPVGGVAYPPVSNLARMLAGPQLRSERVL